MYLTNSLAWAAIIRHSLELIYYYLVLNTKMYSITFACRKANRVTVLQDFPGIARLRPSLVS